MALLQFFGIKFNTDFSILFNLTNNQHLTFVFTDDIMIITTKCKEGESNG